jgi:hypothetical protein
MPANTQPIFTLAGNFTPARIAAANTASDGSGTLVTLVTAGANGTRVDGVRFRNAQVTLAASTAMVHRIFLSNTSGTNFRLIGEIATPAATRTASVIGATSIFTFDQPIIMQSGQIISVCQSAYAGAQDQVDAVAYAGDY